MKSFQQSLPVFDSWLPRGSRIKGWDSLTPGQLVEVWDADLRLYVAIVDQCTEDGSMAWLIEHGLGSRRLFMTGDVTLYQVV